MNLKQLTTTLAGAACFSLVACGGGGADIDRVRADFENPTGSTKNEAAIQAVASKQSGTGALGGLAGLGVTGDALTAQGKGRIFEQFNQRKTFEHRARYFRAVYQGGQNLQPLSPAQASGTCEDAEELQAAMMDLQEDFGRQLANGKEEFSGSVSYSIDLASCSAGEATGKVSGDIKIFISKTKFEFNVSQNFAAVCETGGQQACVDGGLSLEMNGEGLEDMANFSYIAAWDIASSWVAGGATKTATYKGGIRTVLASSGDTGSVSVEYLFYVTSPEGEEFSYVLSIKAEANGENGTASWSIRGKDGEISCDVSSIDGVETGTCTGPDGTINWSSEDGANGWS